MTQIDIQERPTTEKIEVSQSLTIDTIDAMIDRAFSTMNNGKLTSAEQDLGKSDYVHWMKEREKKVQELIKEAEKEFCNIAIHNFDENLR